MSEPEILTFGCRLNAFESEVIRRRAAEAGLRDAVIINTCAVTAEAERQARQAIRRARRAAPARRLIVTGCAAQLDPARYAAMPEVDRVIGDREKLRAASYRLASGTEVGDVMAARDGAPHPVAMPQGRARAFVEIQRGCDHRCTFCIIPFARGPNRSLPVEAVVAQIRKLVRNGYREIVLTGVDITDYGCDFDGRRLLGALVRAILRQIPELPRLRLSSLDPAEIDTGLMEAIGEDARLMPHFHISAQSGSDLILKRMARRHARSDILAFCDAVRRVRPEAVFGADMIAGFPTETEAMFADSLSADRPGGAVAFARLSVFRAAWDAGCQDAADRGRGAQTPGRRAAQGRRRAARCAPGKPPGRARARVLVETGRLGRTEQFVKLRLDRPAPRGALVDAVVTGHGGGVLEGRLRT